MDNTYIIESFVNRIEGIGYKRVGEDFKFEGPHNSKISLKACEKSVTMRISDEAGILVRVNVKYSDINNTWPSIVKDNGRVSLCVKTYRYNNNKLLVRPFTGYEVTLFDD